MYRRRRSARNRYRSRNRYQPRNRSHLTFAPVIVMLCISVGCGYAAAKYVVEPVVNYVPQLKTEEKKETDLTNIAKDKATEDDTDKTIVDEAEVAENEDISGYALQFGCYSGKASAELAMPSIGVEGLKVIEQDELYKIVGEIYKTKADAKKALNELPDTVNAFVTPIYE